MNPTTFQDASIGHCISRDALILMCLEICPHDACVQNNLVFLHVVPIVCINIPISELYNTFAFAPIVLLKPLFLLVYMSKRSLYSSTVLSHHIKGNVAMPFAFKMVLSLPWCATSHVRNISERERDVERETPFSAFKELTSCKESTFLIHILHMQHTAGNSIYIHGHYIRRDTISKDSPLLYSTNK